MSADGSTNARRSLPEGTVTLLFTDIEGSTRLLEQLGGRYTEVLAEHRRLLREAFARHGGVEVDTQGDAFFYGFADASDALAAAAEAQKRLGEGPVVVRMGLHSGEPVVTDEGYVGMDVHRAARICAAAHGGQVLFTERTRSLAETADNRATDLGLHRLKDLGQPVKLFQLGEQRFPPLRTLNATNLPAQPGPLIGREEELSEIVSLLRDGVRALTLTGPGGTGKTRLALQAAAELVDDFKDGVFFVPLAAIRDPELVVSTVEQTLGAKVPLAQHIDERRMLLLVDNLEQVLESSLGLADVLEQCPNLRLLVTSRVLMRIAAEREYQVPPLPADDAVALFVERAAVSEPVAAVEEICRRLDGLPLAVELAAARTRVLPPDKLLARLERRLPLLTSGARDAPARQQTLRATIEWSYDLLSEEEKRLFARLAVFAGSFTAEAAEEVCEGDLDTLQSLIEQSLVRRWAGGRLGMLETIYEYAQERLEPAEGREDLRRRQAKFILEVAESGNLYVEALDSGAEQRWDQIAAELDNIRSALDWALESGEIELGLRIAVALEQFWVTRLPLEGQRWFSVLLAPESDIPRPLRARALRSYGGSATISGHYELGDRLYAEALAEYRAMGDPAGVAHLLHRVAVEELFRRQDPERARKLVNESLELSQAAGSRVDEAQAYNLLAHLARREGDNDAAFALYEQSASLAREIGWTWWLTSALENMADLALELGEERQRDSWSSEALELAHRIGDRQGMVYGLAISAWLAAAAGLTERSGQLWGAIEAEEARGRIGQWEEERETYANIILAHSGPELDRALQDGRLLTLDEAVERALTEKAVASADQSPPSKSQLPSGS